MKHVLFVCGKNRWRSPTAEELFADYPGIVCQSGGTSHDADVVVSTELIDWADLIIVMEKEHKVKIASRFKTHLASKRVVCVNIPDNYKFMDPALVKLLTIKVTPYLPVTHFRE